LPQTELNNLENMKKCYPITLHYLPKSFDLFEKSFLLVATLLLTFLFTTSISAQNSNLNNSSFTINEVDLFISSLRTAEQNSKSSYSNAQNIENLLHQVQPSIYFYSGLSKTYGDRPRCLFTDILSLRGITNSNFLKNNIEIVTIKIDNTTNLNSTIDLALFSKFNKLKYIYILSSVSITENQINKMILNYDEQYSIFYKIDKGE
jgi:hypothetical protein